MSPERWRQIEELYHSALERAPDQRAAFLAQACGGDDDLRREVEALLRHGDSPEALVDRPAWEAAGELLESRTLVGRRISHYEILAKLGEGGMGVVYKAEDTKLRRTVALKFLPAHAVEDPEFRQRFVREAQSAASLDHPNIATVFELDEEHGFLAMELVPGPSLKDRIRERPLKLKDALRIAGQVGEGLRVAHQHGVVHRDINSGNILLTPEGQAKITDFGLATLVDRSRVTKTGAALGTPGYMAPEQARGEKVDGRADLWALGVVLYEMLSGRLPFGGDSDAAIVHSIVHDEAEPLTAQRAGLPIDADRIVATCLAKEPGERYQHIDDLLVDLRRCESREGRREHKAGRAEEAEMVGAVGAGCHDGSGTGLRRTVLFPS